MCEAIVQELNLLIDMFNATEYFPLGKNATYLKSILKEQLPDYYQVLEILKDNQKTCEKVIIEFNESKYLDEVWKLKDLGYLYINFLILIYRTTLLNHFNYLRGEQAQLSSSLEEMSALKALEGEKTKVFEATRHWINAWKEEDFSEQLFYALKEKNLL